MGSRLLPLSLAAVALAAEAGGLARLALYLGLIAVPPAAAAAFVSVSDALEGRPALLRAVTNGLALTLVVVASAVRENAAHGAGVPPLATYALVGALAAYLVPVVAWVLEPVRLPRPRPVPARVTTELR
ncbi:MAG TPA: hypothetical protein VFJ91_02625 [Gaiellaceae bacterium]|nr:hypothetical protein [Gaiellaceae bacterium]